ncbi:MAG: hypothetical protein EB075_13955 [Bacteroidetes bacterium]|nr:hypothetical protein [Bacteroidota bacterium]
MTFVIADHSQKSSEKCATFLPQNDINPRQQRLFGLVATIYYIGAMMKAIYEIRNNKNGKIYIGSTKNLRKRWKEHRSLLNNGKHHSRHLQSAWNKDGGNFTFTVLEEVAQDEDLIPAEQRWLDQTRSYDRAYGYNINPTAANSLGMEHSAEAKEKMREAALRRGPQPPRSEEWSARISASLRGEKNPAAKLNWEKVRQMRAMREAGATIGEIARLFGVNRSAASRVVNRKRWVNDPEESP